MALVKDLLGPAGTEAVWHTSKGSSDLAKLIPHAQTQVAQYQTSLTIDICPPTRLEDRCLRSSLFGVALPLFDFTPVKDMDSLQGHMLLVLIMSSSLSNWKLSAIGNCAPMQAKREVF